MTVPVNDRRIQYVATASQTIFPYDFRIEANTAIEILQTIKLTGVTNTLVLTTDYTVSNVGVDGGGDITLVTGAAVDDIITITGATPLSRTTDFNQAGDFLASDLNAQLDSQIRILQENETKTNRAVLLKDEDTTTSLELPIATERASQFLAFDANGDAIAAAGTTGVTVSAFAETYLDDPTATATRATLGAQEDVITTRGDIIRGSSSGGAERLAIGSSGQNLVSDGTDITWSDDLTVNGNLNLNENTATIASGAITYSGAYMVIDTESAASTDDLDTINGGNGGDIVIINTTNGTRDVVIKHATGNIRIVQDRDITLSDTNDTITFIFDGSNWYEISRSIKNDFLSSKSTNGYTYLPNGLIFQWMTVTSTSDGNEAFSLPITFPNSALAGFTNSATSALQNDFKISGLSVSTITLDRGDSISGSGSVYVFAIGN